MRKLPQVTAKDIHLRDNVSHVSVNLRPFLAPPFLAMIQLQKKKVPTKTPPQKTKADPKHKFPTWTTLVVPQNVRKRGNAHFSASSFCPLEQKTLLERKPRPTVPDLYMLYVCVDANPERKDSWKNNYSVEWFCCATRTAVWKKENEHARPRKVE